MTEPIQSPDLLAGRFDRWAGRVVLVTGASSGIGMATARALAAAGLRVALAARRTDILDDLRDRIIEAGGEAMVTPLDLADEDSIKAMFASIRSAWGELDAVVNNAGVAYHGSIESGSTEHWRQMTEINFLGFAICLREAVANLKHRPDAVIVNISSLSSHRIKPGGGIAYYGASKHAMRAVVEGLRGELATEGSMLKVGMISPGLVDTGMYDTAVPPELGLDAKDRDRFMDPNWIADAVLYMLSTPPHVQIYDIFMAPIGQP